MSAPADVDPFDLPDWLGTTQVVWEPEGGIGGGALVRGRLGAPGEDPLSCDLLAVDLAYPRPVAADPTRTRAHQAWRHGQVLLVTCDDRLTLAVPGSGHTADGVLEAIGRLAKAVGASIEDYSARLRLGGP